MPLAGYADQVSDSSDTPATDRSGLDGIARRSAELVDDALYAPARAEAAELGAASPDALTAEAIRLVARLTGARAAVCISPPPAYLHSRSSPLLVRAGARWSPASPTIPIISTPRGRRSAAGHPSSAARYIAARPLEVADKLADGAYDLVVADVPTHSVSRVVSRSHQLLRTGGALVLIGEHAPFPRTRSCPGTPMSRFSGGLRTHCRHPLIPLGRTRPLPRGAFRVRTVRRAACTDRAA